jgi:hypothetical protein
MVPEGQLMAENDSSWAVNGIDLVQRYGRIYAGFSRHKTEHN